jgi:putative flippase GtrA
MSRMETAKRIGRGTLKPGNWIQLIQFGVVGLSGYFVNLAVFALMVGPVDLHYIPAAVVAFCVAVTNNFWWNRHWTFDARHGHAGFQAARFFTVSVLALGLNLIVLQLLVSAGDMDKVVAQAIAILAATPLNFIGNKLWSFGKPAPRPLP